MLSLDVRYACFLAVVTPFGGIPEETPVEPELAASMKPEMVYMNCYTEAEHASFHVLDVQLPAVTRQMFQSPAAQQPSTCARACWRAGYPYLGVKGYYQCWCGKEVKALHFQKGK